MKGISKLTHITERGPKLRGLYVNGSPTGPGAPHESAAYLGVNEKKKRELSQARGLGRLMRVVPPDLQSFGPLSQRGRDWMAFLFAEGLPSGLPVTWLAA